MPNKMTKNDLRQRLKARRDAISAEDRASASRQIAQRIAASDQLANADLLLLYAPKGSELDLLSLVEVANSRGLPVAFPVCDPTTCTLTFHILEPTAELIMGQYGIPTPPADAPIATPTAHTLCILPGLSFSPDGSRIGYGKGYYDRYLKNFPGIVVGALCSHMLCRDIPTEAHDLPVSLLFTERGVIRCADHARKEEKTPKLQSLLPALTEKLFGKGASSEAKIGAEALPPVRPLHLPPALVLCVFLLLIIARAVDVSRLDRDSETIGAIVLQAVIFLLPAVL